MILIGICCQCKTTPEGEEPAFGYRLGDMVTSESFRQGDGGRDFHLKNFPDSIASDYMRRTKDESNLNILDEIVKERTTAPEHKPAATDLLIHLRLGDVLDNTPYLVKDFLSRYVLYANGFNYVKPLSYYQSILEEMNDLGLSSVILIGGYHKDLMKKSKSEKYVAEIQKFFEANNKTVQTRINGNADEDFIYMCNATYFTPSGGGFSRIVKDIVLMRGMNILIGDD